MKVLVLFAGTRSIEKAFEPRGSKTGTQALKNAVEKARIPVMLCEHIVDICEVE